MTVHWIGRPARSAPQMLTLTPSPASYLRIRASGRLTAADYRRFEPAFAAELERRHLPIPLLLDMRGFDLRPSSIPRVDARHCMLVCPPDRLRVTILSRPRLGPRQPPHLLPDRGDRRRALAPLDHRRRRSMKRSPCPWPDCPRQS